MHIVLKYSDFFIFLPSLLIMKVEGEPCTYYSEHIIICIPPFRKRGEGGFEIWENPPESPFAKGGLLEALKTQPKNVDYLVLPLVTALKQ
jgi:hypothetical protein